MLSEYELTAKELLTKRWVDRFDEEVVRYEAIWGIGRLTKLVSKETQEKWERHMARLNEAISKGDNKNLPVLVEGAVKGLAAIEAEAIKAGHSHSQDIHWNITHPENGTKYRIYKNAIDCRKKAPDGVRKFSLAEVVRIIEAASGRVVCEIKDVFPDAKLVEVSDIDFEEGDEVPF